MTSNNPTDDENFEFNWLQTRKEVGLPDLSAFNDETGSEKFMRKFKENPLVPIGCLLTTTCLTLGLMSMKKGDKKMSQLMMRGRILAQGFTLVALVTGLCIKASAD
ncbi:HIG1 domain family member 2A, mitochondrial [Macrosteles quadrilineatus]|uniref:HIG1 domain family member 2A, mitochondrial n=1 Tax=Macrosteles quadrilineatus TaxID=74068 RepID=UPI0023E109D7|nr:HIG1 domain family member 2A, mitochondrial [Macrosteles quadrilineatus]